MNPKGATLNIVSVDDDPTEAYLLKKILARTATENLVTAFANAELAWAYLGNIETQEPNIIIIDLSLPGLSGLDLLRTIKDHPRLRTTPVIVLSASSDPRDIAAAYNFHASCYVTKRLDPEEHLTALVDLIRFWAQTVELPAQRSAHARETH